MDDRPLPEYGLFIGVFNAVCGALLVLLRRRLPDRYSVGDLALLTVGTHKVSRLVAKDKVTAPLRAPFAEYEEDAGPGEVSESPKGNGFQRAIGELLTCPYCLSQWFAAAGLFGLAVAP